MRSIAIAILLMGSFSARGDEAAGLRERLRDASAQYNMGNYQVALEQFQAAYSASGKHVLLYNIAQCYRQLGDLQKAAINYRSFIRLEPENAAVPTAKDLLAKVEDQLAQEKNVRTAPPTGLRPEPQPVPTAARPAAVPTPQVVAARAPRSYTLPIVTGAAAVACVGAAALFGLQARSAAQDWKSATADPAWSDARSRAQSAMTRANVAWTAAGVLAAATAATLLIDF
jgi:tetratricopeptide (TPR) repeat protein